MAHKICSSCKQDLPIENFYKRASNPDGYRYACKGCNSQHHKNWWKENLVHCRAVARAYGASVIGIYRRRFTSIKQRCNDSKYLHYENYGGRGIQCKFKNADEFVEYMTSTFKQHPKGLQIDRINNDGHYEPGNLRLVTPSENSSNRRFYGK